MTDEEREDTKQIILSSLEKSARRWWWVFGVLGTICAGGFTAGTWVFVTFAKAADVTVLHDRISKVNASVVDMKMDVASLKALNERIEQDYHWQREQTTEIARSVRAKMVKPPAAHEKETP